MKEEILAKEKRPEMCVSFISVQSLWNDSQLRNFALEEFL